MNAKDVVKQSIGMSQMVTQAYLDDLSDADLMVRPAPGANHIAWQLGHLISSEHDMMNSIGKSMPALPEGFVEKHCKESSTSDDATKFLKKSEYLALLKTMHEATLTALDATPESELDQPTPEKYRSFIPTVGAMFNMIGGHEMMHVGQFATVRRKLGKPVVI